jgi:hypothetical protein
MSAIFAAFGVLGLAGVGFLALLDFNGREVLPRMALLLSVLLVPGAAARALDRTGKAVWLDADTTSRLLYSVLPSWIRAFFICFLTFAGTAAAVVAVHFAAAREAAAEGEGSAARSPS